MAKGSPPQSLGLSRTRRPTARHDGGSQGWIPGADSPPSRSGGCTPAGRADAIRDGQPGGLARQNLEISEDEAHFRFSNRATLKGGSAGASRSAIFDGLHAKIVNFLHPPRQGWGTACILLGQNAINGRLDADVSCVTVVFPMRSKLVFQARAARLEGFAGRAALCETTAKRIPPALD